MIRPRFRVAAAALMVAMAVTVSAGAATTPPAASPPAPALTPPTGEVVLHFTGMRQLAGLIRAELTCRAGGGAEPRRLTAAAPVTAPRVTVRFADAPMGQCSARAYRDANANGILDLGAMGIPREPYAFSNNATARFGPPKTEATLFAHAATGTTQTLTIR